MVAISTALPVRTSCIGCYQPNMGHWRTGGGLDDSGPVGCVVIETPLWNQRPSVVCGSGRCPALRARSIVHSRLHIDEPLTVAGEPRLCRRMAPLPSAQQTRAQDAATW